MVAALQYACSICADSYVSSAFSCCIACLGKAWTCASTVVRPLDKMLQRSRCRECIGRFQSTDATTGFNGRSSCLRWTDVDLNGRLVRGDPVRCNGCQKTHRLRCLEEVISQITLLAFGPLMHSATRPYYPGIRENHHQIISLDISHVQRFGCANRISKT